MLHRRDLARILIFGGGARDKDQPNHTSHKQENATSSLFVFCVDFVVSFFRYLILVLLHSELLLVVSPFDPRQSTIDNRQKLP